jgi:hypothetical protein
MTAAQLSLTPPAITGDAWISEDKLYRYTLRRVWDENRPAVCFVALNPSTASADAEDATSRKFLGFAKRWGAGSYTTVNLFAYRATDPLTLLRVADAAADAIGPLNNNVIAEETRRARLVIAAWGSQSDRRLKRLIDERVETVLGVLKNRELHCLGTCKDGGPRHPLYVSYAVEPTRWRAA